MPGRDGLILRIAVGRQMRGGEELGGKQALQSLFAPTDLDLFGVLLDAPLHRQVERHEGLVERAKVTVLFCVGEHAIAVEDERGQRGYQAFPALPN